MIIDAIKYHLVNPIRILDYFNKKGFFDNIPDETFLKCFYRLKTGKKLNLEQPKTFNDKMQWLKINNRNPIFTNMVDKYEVKQHVSRLIGKEYIIPSLGIYDSFDDIDFDKLPNEFVLKCTHDSGTHYICKNKENIDINNLKKYFEKRLKRNFYYASREWPYKNISPRIIVEKYMKDSKSNVLDVYKIFTFSGEPYLIQMIQNDKTSNETIDYFDCDWNRLNLRQNYPNSLIPREKPRQLKKMLELARKLSGNLPFIRVDLYVINDKIYFSEYTFFSDTGFAKFYPNDWDEILGDKIILPTIN